MTHGSTRVTRSLGMDLSVEDRQADQLMSELLGVTIHVVSPSTLPRGASAFLVSPNPSTRPSVAAIAASAPEG
ncbi:hypothetical protein SEA_RASPUTIA_53 [Microbacterium phage Rasputia]|nr:hypothetical protein SEA_RASPUTIA_53 [Microbacterium phage Rasputia]